MPEIKIKTEYIDKLNSLGVYDSWIKLVQSTWHPNKRKPLESASTFYIFITISFSWADSTNGHQFWREIARS